MATRRSHWRDIKGWSEYGTPLTTPSNEAAKLYDAVLTQYVGWYDDDTLGGLEKSCAKMLEADSNFVMGHVIANGLDALGTGRTLSLDKEFDEAIKNMSVLAEKQKVSDREKKHVNAVKLWAEGELTSATNIWEDILVDHPLDILALKFAHDSYFYLGYHPQMRDSIARVIPSWNKHTPLFSYLLGMYAFGLEETNFYPLAERNAREALQLNVNDAWSTHALAHVFEMEGRQDEGIKFMTSTENDWNICGMIACHNYWHEAVFHVEKGNYEEARGIFQKEILKRSQNSGAMLDFVDAASILYRLEMEGVEVKELWNDVHELIRTHLDDHVLTFNDAHMMMACLGADKEDHAEQLLNSMREFIKNGKGDNRKISEEVGLPLGEAMMAYKDGDYAKAVELAYPIRYRILTIGGSHAQRDVFNQFLIQAAMKSGKKEHNCNLARFLLTERKALKQNAPLTDRLMHRALAVHT